MRPSRDAFWSARKSTLPKITIFMWPLCVVCGLILCCDSPFSMKLRTRPRVGLHRGCRCTAPPQSPRPRSRPGCHLLLCPASTAIHSYLRRRRRRSSYLLPVCFRPHPHPHPRHPRCLLPRQCVSLRPASLVRLTSVAQRELRLAVPSRKARQISKSCCPHSKRTWSAFCAERWDPVSWSSHPPQTSFKDLPVGSLMTMFFRPK